MKIAPLLAFCALLCGCETAPLAPPPSTLFNDALFSRPSEAIGGDPFAVSDAMRRFIQTDIARHAATKGYQQALFDALYAKNELRLEYDSATTRDAAQAFAGRAGNCLSLVIMTAAFAKEMGLPVRYQSAYLDETWSRDADTHYFIGHVNVTVNRKPTRDYGFGGRDADWMTIDFLPPLESKALHTREIPERTIVAMYDNNKAAEALARGALDDAYAWARESIAKDPAFVSAYNTLGVVYQRHGNLPEARAVLAAALEREPDNTHVMSNLASVLAALGRTAEADALAARLDRLEPNPPFAYFYRGLKAMSLRDYSTARALFAKEVARAPYYHEFRFWLAAAYLGLGDRERARKELGLAIEYSTTRSEHDLYAAKLDRLEGHAPR